MATPPEGPALDKERDTTIDTQEQRRRRGPSIGHDRTMTPVPGETSLSQLVTSTNLAKQLQELEPGAMVGEYRIDGLLGEGGMGRVYSATHPVIGKKAAVKVLHPRMSANAEVVERFVQEARAVNQIGHPNIVDIFSFGALPDGQSYFVMECLKGESLHERIRRLPLTRDELCHYVTDISHALEAAHDKDIIHRDLKPENVYLHEIKGRVQIKLLDFGIAKLANTDDNRVERTRTGAMMGTPKYIAPEQARGYAVDHRVDIYSLGVMIFELAARRLPFVADNAMDLVASHLHETPPRMSSFVPDIPKILDDVVDAMLAKEADKRPSLAYLRQVLDEVRAMPPGDAAYTVPDLRPPGAALSVIDDAPARKSKLPLIGGLLAVGAIGGVIAVTQLGGSDPAPVIEAKPAPEIKPEPPKPEPPKPEIKPEPPKPASPATTRVTVKLRNTKGALIVDDQPVKTAPPWTLQLTPGNHSIQFRPPGGSPNTRSITVGNTPITIEFGPLVTPKPPKPPPPKPPGGDDDFVDPKKPKKGS